MLTVADMGEGGVKNGQKSADVLYGWPLPNKVNFGSWKQKQHYKVESIKKYNEGPFSS